MKYGGYTGYKHWQVARLLKQIVTSIAHALACSTITVFSMSRLVKLTPILVYFFAGKLSTHDS